MIDLNKFCGDKIQAIFKDPFNDDKWTYATNGHVMVRVPRLPEYSEGDEGLILACQKFFDGIEEIKQFVPMPDYKKPKSIKCNECNGTGKSTKIPCPDCAGTGYTKCNKCGSEIICKNCYGQRIIEGLEKKMCTGCEGKGKFYTNEGRASFFGLYVSAEYLDLFTALPNIRVVKPILPDASDTPIRFSFDGGYGFLMPMRSY